jgi:hypothetical protein
MREYDLLADLVAAVTSKGPGLTDTQGPIRMDIRAMKTELWRQLNDHPGRDSLFAYAVNMGVLVKMKACGSNGLCLTI